MRNVSVLQRDRYVPSQSSRATGSVPHSSAPYIEVDDRGSAVTLISIAGPLGGVGGVLGGIAVGQGQPSASIVGCTYGFEFHQTLRKSGADFNLVFLRDVHNAFYHATPDGNPGGLDFFADTIRDVITSLGSTHNVALGCSMGGASALYFGARCKLSQVIAFSPIFPLVEFDSHRSWTRQLVNVRSLFGCPGGYAMNIALACVVRQLYRNTALYLDQGGIPSFTEEYFTGGDVPDATIYYGDGCAVDREHSLILADCPTVERIPVPTWEHNTAGYLKRRGKLVDAIFGPIERNLSIGLDSEEEPVRPMRQKPR